MPQAEKAELYEPMHARKPIVPIDVSLPAAAEAEAEAEAENEESHPEPALVKPIEQAEADSPSDSVKLAWNSGPIRKWEAPAVNHSSDIWGLTNINNTPTPVQEIHETPLSIAVAAPAKYNLTRKAPRNYSSNNLDAIVKEYEKHRQVPMSFTENEGNKKWLLDVVKRVNVSSRINQSDKTYPRPLVIELIKLKSFVDIKTPDESLTTGARLILDKYSNIAPYKEIFTPVLGDWGRMPKDAKTKAEVKKVSNNIIDFVLHDRRFVEPPRFRRGGRSGSTRAVKKISKRNTRKLQR
jgi:hypothetical protein